MKGSERLHQIGQIVMARQVDQSIFKAARLMGYSLYAVINTYQKWSKNAKARLSQTSEKVNAGYGRKVSEQSVPQLAEYRAV